MMRPKPGEYFPTMSEAMRFVRRSEGFAEAYASLIGPRALGDAMLEVRHTLSPRQRAKLSRLHTRHSVPTARGTP